MLPYSLLHLSQIQCTIGCLWCLELASSELAIDQRLEAAYVTLNNIVASVVDRRLLCARVTASKTLSREMWPILSLMRSPA